MDRRQFLKTSAAAGVVVGGAAALGAGFQSSDSPNAHQGWELNETDQYFDRKPFEVDKPHYEKIGEVVRPSGFDHVFSRRGAFPHHLTNYREGATPIELLHELGVMSPEDATYDIIATEKLRDYYKGYEERGYLKEDVRYYLEVLPFRGQMMKEVTLKGDDALHAAFFDGYSSLRPGFNPGGNFAVESKEYDFEGVYERKFPVKDPAEMSRLIKQVSTLFGSPIVRITELKEDWVYATHSGGRGYEAQEPIVVPKHWKYAIVVGSPMEWSGFKANPSFGQSMDGYQDASILAERLTYYIKRLGYPARPNSPFHGYELVMPPILIDAGVGEQGRTGTCITPDFGGNFRPSIVLTDMPLQVDKPIDVGIQSFCFRCKICADQCPSNSISKDDEHASISGRGYKGWSINTSTCHNYWMSVPMSGSCRICIAVCPFSKESGWIHRFARDVAVRDKTGITHSMLTWMERNFFGEKEASEYIYELGSFEYPTVKEKPWWLIASDFVEL